MAVCGQPGCDNPVGRKIRVAQDVDGAGTHNRKAAFKRLARQVEPRKHQPTTTAKSQREEEQRLIKPDAKDCLVEE